MEKNASPDTMILKADRPAAIPAAAVITVDVDPEALNCPKCLRPLEPPVFQCAAGHVLCSTCHGDLPDKDKCVSCFVNSGFSRCFIPTSYGRCLAMERVLQSVRVACPHGCAAAKMLYHEKAEHQKTCAGSSTTVEQQAVLLQQGPPGDCSYELVLPKVLPSSRASVTVTITGGDVGKKKISGRGKGSMGSLVRMGPCGGIGGNVKETSMSDVDRIVQVVVRHGNAVDAISVMYERKGKEAWTDRWGGGGGNTCLFSLQQDEYLTSVRGHYGQFNGFVVVRSLTFVSNLRSYGPFGMEDGVPFALHAGAGGKIVGFHARSGQFLDAIGTYVKMDDY
ncbi:Horcolin [Hordeum vulgare]|nr:Horcolin [Hordeum vulgare]